MRSASARLLAVPLALGLTAALPAPAHADARLSETLRGTTSFVSEANDACTLSGAEFTGKVLEDDIAADGETRKVAKKYTNSTVSNDDPEDTTSFEAFAVNRIRLDSQKRRLTKARFASKLTSSYDRALGRDSVCRPENSVSSVVNLDFVAPRSGTIVLRLKLSNGKARGFVEVISEDGSRSSRLVQRAEGKVVARLEVEPGTYFLGFDHRINLGDGAPDRANATNQMVGTLTFRGR